LIFSRDNRLSWSFFLEQANPEFSEATCDLSSTPDVIPGAKIVWRCEKDSKARQQAIKQAMDSALADAKSLAGNSALHVEELHVRFPVALLPRIPSLDQGAIDSGLVPIRVEVPLTCKH
jgi:hypothetical protein